MFRGDCSAEEYTYLAALFPEMELPPMETDHLQEAPVFLLTPTTRELH